MPTRVRRGGEKRVDVSPRRRAQVPVIVLLHLRHVAINIQRLLRLAGLRVTLAGVHCGAAGRNVGMTHDVRSPGGLRLPHRDITGQRPFIERVQQPIPAPEISFVGRIARVLHHREVMQVTIHVAIVVNCVSLLGLTGGGGPTAVAHFSQAAGQQLRGNVIPSQIAAVGERRLGQFQRSVVSEAMSGCGYVSYCSQAGGRAEALTIEGRSQRLILVVSEGVLFAVIDQVADAGQVRNRVVIVIELIGVVVGAGSAHVLNLVDAGARVGPGCAQPLLVANEYLVAVGILHQRGVGRAGIFFGSGRSAVELPETAVGEVKAFSIGVVFGVHATLRGFPDAAVILIEVVFGSRGVDENVFGDGPIIGIERSERSGLQLPAPPIARIHAVLPLAIRILTPLLGVVTEREGGPEASALGL